MSKLFILLISLIFSIQNLYGQKILRLSYNTALSNDVAQIEIGNDAFKITGSYFEYLKIKEDRDSMYLVSLDEAGNCSAIKEKLSFDNEYGLFNYIPTDTLLKIDTIYYNQDTIIHHLRCKKVELRYILGGLSATSEILNRIVPIDTIKNILWINNGFKVQTPFSFESLTLKGLIIQSQLERVDGGYLDDFGKIRKKWTAKPITSHVSYIEGDTDNYFSLKTNCKVIEQIDECPQNP